MALKSNTSSKLTTSKNGQRLIKQFEGLKLVAYQCSAGVWTIGWGTTRIKGKPVTEGLKITLEQAQEYFTADLVPLEKAIATFVKVPLTQNQFDALVSFIYNIGIGGFANSSALLFLNKKEYKICASRMLLWNKTTDPKTKKLVVSPGLINRRKQESALFLSNDVI